MSLSHKKIANTKYAVTKVLEKMNQNVDKYVNLLVEARPEEFTGNENSVVDPFTIVGLMALDLRDNFEKFADKVKSGEVVITKEEEKQTEAKIMEFNSSKKKDETTH